jgi:hypothetical protein
VAIDPGNVLRFFLPLLLCLAGFHGVLFYAAPWKKTAAWLAFQSGLVAFLFQLGGPENPFPSALAVATLAATAAVGVLLAVFGVKWGGSSKGSEGGKKARGSAR